MQQSDNQHPRKSRLAMLAFALIPVVLLGGLLALFGLLDPMRSITKEAFPPVEELSIQRVELNEEGITAYIVNAGPDPVTVAQVLVDEAYWAHEIEPSRTIPRLGRAKIHIPYMWVRDEAHVIKLISSTGVTFEHEIEVAVPTPQPSLALFAFFTMLGIYVGVIPVGLGLLWFPFLRRTPRKWMEFFLAFTIGLLLFLGVDAITESLGITEQIPEVFEGVGILLFGFVAAVFLLTAAQKLMATDGGRRSAFALAYSIALGIGLHNLGEGLAIGAAYALGNLALGSTLVIGFTLHNTTEGLAIIAPIAQRINKRKYLLGHLVLLGLIGGIPTIFGAWMGGFTYSPMWALLFLAVGAGAIFQVIWQIIGQMSHQRGGTVILIDLPNVLGLLAGLVVMYGTGLFVAA